MHLMFNNAELEFRSDLKIQPDSRAQVLRLSLTQLN